MRCNCYEFLRIEASTNITIASFAQFGTILVAASSDLNQQNGRRRINERLCGNARAET